MNISKGFTYLPDCIYTSIQTYLTQDDYQQLLNTSKKEFHLLRKKTILFHLTESYSIKYCEDENFRYELLEKIENPLKQIRIKLHYTNIKYYKDLFDLCPVPLICTLSPFYEYEENISLPHVKEFTITDLHHEGVDGFNITAFINFNHCKKVILLKCSAIVDISPLKDCDYIELGNCQNVRDFSSLGRQKTLIIEGNDYLTNIMNLHSIRRLILDQCYNVEDVSPLHGVYDLSLKCCRAVADISSLGGHHRLEISDCCPVLFGYLALRDIPIVELCGCNISDVSVLSNAKVVYLESCNDIVDVSSLRRVKELTLSYCSKIEDISMLTTVRKLTLCRLPHLKKFDGINKMKNLCLRLSTSQDVMLERFPNVRSIECPIKLHLPFFPSFTNLHSLTLSHAKFISPITIDVSVDIHTVILQYCIVKNISGLGKNRVVQFLECGGNELDVSNLATVSLVSFIKCRFTDVNYESLINVPRLKIDPLSITQ